MKLYTGHITDIFRSTFNSRNGNTIFCSTGRNGITTSEVGSVLDQS